MCIDKTVEIAAREHYELGNRYRSQGQWHLAINEYTLALSLDANSPAKEAKEMLCDILNFYNRDAYNP